MFNAREARIMTKKVRDTSLNSIIEEIKIAASEGKFVLYVYTALKEDVISSLISLGFNVNHQPIISIQKDSLYYTITW